MKVIFFKNKKYYEAFFEIHFNKVLAQLIQMRKVSNNSNTFKITICPKQTTNEHKNLEKNKFSFWTEFVWKANFYTYFRIKSISSASFKL